MHNWKHDVFPLLKDGAIYFNDAGVLTYTNVKRTRWCLRFNDKDQPHHMRDFDKAYSMLFTAGGRPHLQYRGKIVF